MHPATRGFRALRHDLPHHRGPAATTGGSIVTLRFGEDTQTITSSTEGQARVVVLDGTTQIDALFVNDERDELVTKAPYKLIPGQPINLTVKRKQDKAALSTTNAPARLTWNRIDGEGFKPTPDVKLIVEKAAKENRRLAKESGKDTGEQTAPESPYLVFMSSQPVAVGDLPKGLALAAQVKERALFGYRFCDDAHDATGCNIDEVSKEFPRLRSAGSSTRKIRLAVLIFPFDQALYSRLFDDGLAGLIQTTNSGVPQ